MSQSTGWHKPPYFCLITIYLFGLHLSRACCVSSACILDKFNLNKYSIRGKRIRDTVWLTYTGMVAQFDRTVGSKPTRLFNSVLAIYISCHLICDESHMCWLKSLYTKNNHAVCNGFMLSHSVLPISNSCHLICSEAICAGHISSMQRICVLGGREDFSFTDTVLADISVAEMSIADRFIVK